MFYRVAIACLVTTWGIASLLAQDEPAPQTPKEATSLFNGKDLRGLTTWLADTQRKDPRGVFQVTDGMLHLSGDGNGYLATEQAWQNYHLVAEYKWGEQHKGKFVRNSGVLLHAIGLDGNAGGAWPSCIECQLAQGCVGDLILIRGKDAQGKAIPVQVTTETELAPDGRRRRWKAGGEKKVFPPTKGQIWWNHHDWDFAEALDTRGKDDVESPLDEWTRVECIADGNRLTILVNGQTVNQVTDVYPAAGRILLQMEGSEIYFRTFEIKPIKRVK